MWQKSTEESSRRVCSAEPGISKRSRVRTKKMLQSHLLGSIDVIVCQKPTWIAESARGEGENEGFYPLVSGSPRADVTCFRAGEKTGWMCGNLEIFTLAWGGGHLVSPGDTFV